MFERQKFFKMRAMNAHFMDCFDSPLFRHAHKHTVMELKWNRNGNWLLTASRDHLIKVFDIRNLKEEMQTFKGHKKEATGTLLRSCQGKKVHIFSPIKELQKMSFFLSNITARLVSSLWGIKTMKQ